MIKRVSIFIGIITLALLTSCGQINNKFKNNDLGLNVIDYDKLDGYEVKTIDKDKVPSWYIDYTDFVKKHREDVSKNIESLKNVLDAKVVDSMNKGLETRYFEMEALRVYNTSYFSISNILSKVPYTNTLYNSYTDIEPITDEEFNEKLNDLSSVSELVSDEHIMDIIKTWVKQYESIIKYKVNNIKDEDIDSYDLYYMYYYDLMNNNYDKINSIDLKIESNGNSKIVHIDRDELEKYDYRTLKNLNVNQLKKFYTDKVNTDELDYYMEVSLKDSVDVELSLANKLVASDSYNITVSIENIEFKETEKSFDELKDSIINKTKNAIAMNELNNEITELDNNTEGEHVEYDDEHDGHSHENQIFDIG